MPFPTVSAVDVTILDELGAPVPGVKVVLQRPNKPAKPQGPGNPNPPAPVVTDALGIARSVSTNQGGMWQVALADSNAVTNLAPVYKFGQGPVATVTLVRIPVSNSAFTLNADPDVDLAFVHDVLSAAQEIFLQKSAAFDTSANPPTSQADVNTLRLYIRALVYTQLTRAGDPAPPVAPQPPTAGEEATQEGNTEQIAENDVALADLDIDLKLTCVQCRSYYYTTTSPYYMNYTWYMNCLNAPCTQ